MNVVIFGLTISSSWGNGHATLWRSLCSSLAKSDAAIVTSYCPDALDATAAMLDSSARLKIFYDLDTPITLERLERGETADYLWPEGLEPFDVVLSYTGGTYAEDRQEALGRLFLDTAPRRTGSGAPSSCAAPCCASCTSCGARARRAIRTWARS